MGQRCLNLGNPKEALSYFTKVLSLDPNHKKGLIKKGNVLGKIGKYQRIFMSLTLKFFSPGKRLGLCASTPWV